MPVAAATQKTAAITPPRIKAVASGKRLILIVDVDGERPALGYIAVCVSGNGRRLSRRGRGREVSGGADCPDLRIRKTPNSQVGDIPRCVVAVIGGCRTLLTSAVRNGGVRTRDADAVESRDYRWLEIGRAHV